MAFYVNIDSSYSTVGAGTQTDPWNWQQLYSRLSALPDSNEDYIIYGTRIIHDDLNIKFSASSGPPYPYVYIYRPCTVNNTSAGYTARIITDGDIELSNGEQGTIIIYETMLEADEIRIVYAEIDGSYVKANRIELSARATGSYLYSYETIYNCDTFKASATTCELFDSILNFSAFNGNFVDLTIDSCVCKAASQDALTGTSNIGSLTIATNIAYSSAFTFPNTTNPIVDFSDLYLFPNPPFNSHYNYFEGLAGYSKNNMVGTWYYGPLTYYVNLNGTGISAAGTSAQPLSYQDFYYSVSDPPSASSHYKIRGFCGCDVTTVNTQTQNSIAYQYEAWDKELYGPWGFSASTTIGLIGTNVDIDNSYIKDGIFEFGSIGILINNCIYNSYFKGTAINLYTTTPKNFSAFGCTFDVDDIDLNVSANDDKVNFYDCVMNFPSFSPELGETKNLNVYANNCAFSATSGTYRDGGLTTFRTDHCQFEFSSSTSFPSVHKQKGYYAYHRWKDDITVSGTKNWTSNYPTGLYGKTRTNIGAFYFKRKYYVDLSDATTGNEGTSADPLGYQDFKSYVTSTSSDAYDYFYVKGTLSNALYDINMSAHPGNTLINWLSDRPYAILIRDLNIGTSAAADLLTVKNGVFSTISDHYNENINFYTSHITNRNDKITLRNCNCYGCTLVDGGGLNCLGTGNILTDCIVDTSTSVSGTATCRNVISDKTHVTFSANADSITYENCQFSRTMPTWNTSLGDPPTIAYNKKWSYYNLFPSVSFSGTNNFSAYSTGLWGKDRFTAGALFFGTSSFGDYYVDLEETTSGHAGIITDPYNLFDLERHYWDKYFSATSTFHIKGFTTLDRDYICSGANNNYTVKGWDREPWVTSAASYNLLFMGSVGGNYTGKVCDWVTSQNLLINSHENEFDEFDNQYYNSYFTNDTLTISAATTNGTHGFHFCGCTINARKIKIRDYAYAGNPYVTLDLCLTSALTFDNNAGNTTLVLNGNNVFTNASVQELTAGSTQNFYSIINTSNKFGVTLLNDLLTTVNPQLSSCDVTEFSFSDNFNNQFSATGSFMADNPNDIRYGFKNAYRKGVGAFLFDTQHYVNLSNTGMTTQRTGTSLYPWTRDQFYNLYNDGNSLRLIADDSLVDKMKYKIRGSMTLTSATFNTSGSRYENWLSSEPWTIQDTGNTLTFKNCVISGARIESLSALSVSGVDFYDCFIRSSKNRSGSFRDSNFYACTIIDGFIVPSATSIFNFTDCVISTDTQAPSAIGTDALLSAYFHHCLFSNTSGTFTSGFSAHSVFSATNCEFGWNSPINLKVNPPINGTREQYNYNLFNISLAGSQDWTLYPTGMWGFERYGIGAFYFGPLSGGHIGAFYFGEGLSTTVSASTLSLSAVLYSAADIGLVHRESTPTDFLHLLLKAPTIKVYEQFVLDFEGSPTYGSSPLTINFSAKPIGLGNFYDTYEIAEYQWFFDWGTDNTTSAITSATTISHEYTGYTGQQFDVRLVAVVRSK